MRYIVLMYIGLLSATAVCQEYSWQAEVDSFETTGFHQIKLEPEVTGALQPGYPDLRILDETGQQVAYVLRHEEATEKWTNFVSYPIISKDYNNGWYWDDHYIIKNPEKTTIDHIVIKVANFIDTRYAYLSGSNDGRQWFIIKDGYTLHNIVSEEEDFQYKVLDFPKSSYTYYRLRVDDHYYADDPINILEAGYFLNEVTHGKYSEVMLPAPVQTDSAEIKQTIVEVNLTTGNYIDKIAFDIGGAELYHRRVGLYNKVWTSDTTFSYDLVRSFWISSTHLNELHFNKLYSEGLRLIIYNNDDRPLEVLDVRCYQLNSYAIANLDPTSSYTAAFGNDSIHAPLYDLRFFEKDIPEELPWAYITNIKPVPVQVVDVPLEIAEDEAGAESAAVKSEKPFYEQPYFIWIAIAAVAVILGYMSTRMLAEMKGND